jgi:uncharacterized cupredoxin-like copper-binding protein
VFFFGREPSESKAAEGGTTAAQTTTAAATTTQATTTTATTTTTSTAATTTSAAAQKIAVKETEFKIALAQSSLKPGKYELDLSNDGQIAHDLVVKGPGVNDQKTPLINHGGTAVLKVDLQSGTYELYCSVPGHKAAGMDLKIKVS